MVGKTIRTNENGKEEVVYVTSRTALVHWLTVVGQILIIGVIVMGAVRWGVEAKCLEIINCELQSPNGRIHRAMDLHRMSCRIDEVVQPMQIEVAKLKMAQGEIRLEQKEIRDDIREDLREIKRLIDEIRIDRMNGGD